VLLGAFPILPAAKWEKITSSEALQESLCKQEMHMETSYENH